jgi:hypothetical protein
MSVSIYVLLIKLQSYHSDCTWQYWLPQYVLVYLSSIICTSIPDISYEDNVKEYKLDEHVTRRSEKS